MVQMKGRRTIKRETTRILYIPHGSDESLQYLRRRNIRYILYIPHGSDERSAKLIQNLRFPRLYIPHGSDERIPTATVVTSLTIFISHMVQMKVNH